MGGGAAAGGIAYGILFFMFLVGDVILGLYAGAYAAHVFLVTVDGTASGYDDVTWPDEPYLDWLWKLAYLAWLVTLYAVPLVFYARYQMRTPPADVALAKSVAAFAATAWLLFPLTMLSSMGGPSRWLVFHPPALRRAAKGGGSMVVFYLLSGPVLAAAAVSAATMIFLGPLPFAAVGGLGLAMSLLIYGRLFGRLALALGQVDGGVKVKSRPKFRASPQIEAAARDPMARGGRAHFVQPEDLPPTNAPDPDARVGYNVRLDDAPAEAPAAARRPVDLAEGQYDLSDGPPELRRERGPIPDEWLNPRPYEMELAGYGKKPARPKHPWAGGIFTFPFRRANYAVLAWLATMLAVFGLFLRLAVQFAPV